MGSFTEVALSEQYIKARAIIKKGDKIVYVEDPNDILFWSRIFDNTYDIRIYQNNLNKCETGKRNLEKIYSKCHSSLLVAVDCDYDYLCPEQNRYAYSMCSNPYVIHTVGYSRESVIYSSGYLSHIIDKINYTFRFSNINIDLFLSSYSRLFYPVFVRFLYLINNQDFMSTDEKKQKILKDKLNKFLTIDIKLNADLSIDISILDRKEKEINRIVRFLDKKIYEREAFSKFIESFNQKGLTSDNMYRFINGHVLEEKIITPLLKEIHRLRKEYEIQNMPQYNDGQGVRINQIVNHYKNKCNLETLMGNHLEILESLNDELFIQVKAQLLKIKI